MTTPTPIIPSVGRKVWYYASSQQAEPWDATVLKVHATPETANPYSAVNLLVFDPDTGVAQFRPCIAFHDEASQWPNEHYRWMPYQTAQAGKAATPADGQSAVQSVAQQQAAALRQTIETKVYTDGSSATGVAPLPDQSPEQQDAAAAAEQGGTSTLAGQAEPGQLP